MRILIVAGLAGPGSIAGGVWSVASEQAAWLRGQGHQVSLVGGWLGNSPPNDGNTYIRVRQLIPGGGLKFLVGAGWIPTLRSLIRQNDLVHIHLARDFMTTSALSLASTRRVVVQPHGMISVARTPETKVFDFFFKKKYLEAPVRWISITTREQEELLQFGVHGDRIIRIDNAISQPLANPVKEIGSLKVGFLSRLHARKNPRLFTAAASHFKSNTRIKFLIAGPDQGELPGILTDLKTLDLETTTAYLGPLTRQASLDFLSNLDILILPSVGEIAPMVVLEAAALGKAIVLTADCGLSEELKQDEAALIIQPHVEEIVEAVELLAKDGNLRASLGKRAKKHYLEHWSIESMGRSLSSLYEEVLGE